jgi:hypothetical protein
VSDSQYLIILSQFSVKRKPPLLVPKDIAKSDVTPDDGQWSGAVAPDFATHLISDENLVPQKSRYLALNAREMHSRIYLCVNVSQRLVEGFNYTHSSSTLLR